MTLASSECLTLADWKSRYNEDTFNDIVNLVSQNNEILDDMPFRQANSTTGHKTTVRTGLPRATWRKLNYGVPLAKSTTATITDTLGMLEIYSRIDQSLVSLEDNEEVFRLQEDMAFIDGLSQQMASTVFYGNEQRDLASFTGLAPRYNTLDRKRAASAANVIDAGGLGATNSSIWLCCWGPTTGFRIFPKGSKAGLQRRNVTTDAPVQDEHGDFYQAYQTHYKWDIGLTIRDWRYFVRICNIDVTKLKESDGPQLIDLMMEACYRPPTMPRSAAHVQLASSTHSGTPLSFGRPAFYTNRTLATALSRQAMRQSNMLLQLSEYDGRPTLSFRGIPIRICDALLENEARVV